MPRRKADENHIRKLIRLGEGSIAVTIPIDVIRELRYREKQKVTVKRDGKRIVIEDWKK